MLTEDSRRANFTNERGVDGTIRDAQDVLDRLLGVGATHVRRVGPALEPALERVVEAVELGSRSCDAVASASGLGAGDAAVALSRLELIGYLRVDLDGRYARTALATPAGDRGPVTRLDA